MNIDQEVDLYVSTLTPRPPTAEVAKFKILCQRTQLSPVTRQIYLLPRKGAWMTLTSIDGFRAIAGRSPKYRGQVTEWVMRPEGAWTDVPPDGKPYAARVGVYMEGRDAPTYGIAVYKDYATGQMWDKFPSTMIAKCAEALALRKAFPVECAGLYTSEEMAQAGVPPAPAKDGGALVVASDVSAARLRMAATLEELEEVRLSLKKANLSPEDQLVLSPIYAARKKELQG